MGKSETAKSPKPPAFDSAVQASMERRAAICAQRGTEYRDSWDVTNINAPHLTSVMRLLGFGDQYENREGLRLLMVAALCDVKISRMIGPWKDDTLEDLGNYLDALSEFARQYREGAAA